MRCVATLFYPLLLENIPFDTRLTQNLILCTEKVPQFFKVPFQHLKINCLFDSLNFLFCPLKATVIIDIHCNACICMS